MNGFSATIADEFAQTRSQLLAANERRDDAGVASALERLRDLTEISERAREGLVPPSP